MKTKQEILMEEELSLMEVRHEIQNHLTEIEEKLVKVRRKLKYMV